MLKIYHGSSDSNIKKLLINHNKDGKVYVTSNRNNALVYATRKYINLFKTIDGIIYFYNIYNNLFERLYKDKIGYIYYSILDENYLYKINRGKDCNIDDAYYSLNNIELTNKEEVNVYDEFMKLKEEGIFKIVDDENILKNIRNNYENYFRKEYFSNSLTESEIEYFKDLDWMIDYNQVKDLSEDEMIKLAESIGEERDGIANSFNSMSEEERKKHTDMVTKCDLLEFKFYSLRDVLWFKQGHISMELPEGIDYPEGYDQEKSVKKVLKRKNKKNK